MNRSKSAFLATILAVLISSTTACDKSHRNSEGLAEKAGATIGKTIDQVTAKAGRLMKRAAVVLKASGKKAQASISKAVKKIEKGGEEGAAKITANKK